MAKSVCIQQNVRAFAVHDVQSKIITESRIGIDHDRIIIVSAVNTLSINIAVDIIFARVFDIVSGACLVILQDRIGNYFVDFPAGHKQLQNFFAGMRVFRSLGELNNYIVGYDL